MEKVNKNFPCHPELAAPLVADEKAAYKGGCSQSISGSYHHQKCSAICTQKSNVGLKAQPTSTAFTLAEVLITLGIIGVVAAMTLPTLIANYQKKVVATHLKKFYTVMLQAIKLAEAENGDIKYWPPECSDDASQCFRDWYNKYLDKHIKSIKKDDSDSLWYKVVFADGTGFMAYTNETALTDHIAHFTFCINSKKCTKNIFDGQNSFLFSINNEGRFIASLEESQDDTRSQLLESCSLGNRDNPDVSSVGKRHACARLIQIDGWEIKPDYSWNQSIITK